MTPLIRFLLPALAAAAVAAAVSTAGAEPYEADESAPVRLAALLRPVTAPAAAAEAETTRENTTRPARHTDAGGSATFVLREKDLVTRLEKAYQGMSRAEGTLSLALGRPWSDLALDAPADAVDIELLAPPRPARAVTLDFRIRLFGEIHSEWRLPVFCRLEREICRAGEKLPRGSRLDPSGFDAVTVDVLGRPGDWVSPALLDLRYETVRSIPRGSFLRSRDIKRIPLVRRGELVKVKAHRGGLTITLKARALDDGKRDETILVRNPDSNRTLHARIIDENLLEIHL